MDLVPSLQNTRSQIMGGRRAPEIHKFSDGTQLLVMGVTAIALGVELWLNLAGCLVSGECKGWAPVVRLHSSFAFSFALQLVLVVDLKQSRKVGSAFFFGSASRIYMHVQIHSVATREGDALRYLSLKTFLMMTGSLPFTEQFCTIPTNVLAALHFCWPEHSSRRDAYSNAGLHIGLLRSVSTSLLSRFHIPRLCSL